MFSCPLLLCVGISVQSAPMEVTSFCLLKGVNLILPTSRCLHEPAHPWWNQSARSHLHHLSSMSSLTPATLPFRACSLMRRTTKLCLILALCIIKMLLFFLIPLSPVFSQVWQVNSHWSFETACLYYCTSVLACSTWNALFVIILQVEICRTCLLVTHILFIHYYAIYFLTWIVLILVMNAFACKIS